MKKNRVGIVTWFSFDNYGTNLQAFALQFFLNNNQVDAKVIDYVPKSEKKEEHKKNFIQKILDFYINYKYKKDLYGKASKFNLFREKNIRFSKKYKKQDINKINDFFDIFISGSDQVWNPNFLDPVFYLNFTKKKKIAYAPSFAVKAIDKDKRIIVKNYLKKYDILTVREESGRKIIYELLKRNADVVVDPTLLLNRNEWSRLESKRIINDKYILCYFLSEKSSYWKYVNNIRRNTGYKIIIIPVTRKSYFKKGKKLIDIGPKEFLSLIDNAEIVCTDSYHGLIFSLIYNKKFSVFKKFSDEDKNSQNSRIIDLLNYLSLSDHIIEDEKLTYEVDNYNDINCKLRKLINKSIDTLLKGVKGDEN